MAIPFACPACRARPGKSGQPERVAADARNEKITLAYARREHGVVLEPGTFKVDAAATRALREARA